MLMLVAELTVASKLLVPDIFIGVARLTTGTVVLAAMYIFCAKIAALVGAVASAPTPI